MLCKPFGLTCLFPLLSGMGRRKRQEITVINATAEGDNDDEQKNSASNLQSALVESTAIRIVTLNWHDIASFCSPREVCTLERICTAIRRTLQEHSQGARILQKYWYARWYHLTWNSDDAATTTLAADSVDEKKRKLLAFSMTKSEGKKVWKAMYREAYEAFLRRNLRGHGVSNREVQRKVPTVQLNEAIASECSPARWCNEVTEAIDMAEATLLREDAAFVRSCLDGGVTEEHFLHRHGVQDDDAPKGRKEYRSDKRLGKRQGKHSKGGTALWTNWSDGGNYDY